MSDDTYTWLGGAGNFGSASSWTFYGKPTIPVTNPPTNADDEVITVPATLFGSGFGNLLLVEAAVTISSPLVTDIFATFIGNGALPGSVTVSGAGTVWSGFKPGGFGYISIVVGNNNDGTLTVSGGAKILDGGNDIIGSGLDDLNTAAVTVDGSGSNWTDGGIEVADEEGPQGERGSLTISNSGSVDTGDFFLGTFDDSPSATLLIESGGSFTSSDDSLFTGIGFPGGEVDSAISWRASATVKGSGSVWNVTGSWLACDGQLTIRDGGEVESQGGSTSGAVTVTGTGSAWQMEGFANSQLEIGSSGSLTVADGGAVTSQNGITMAGGSTVSVDATSVIEAGSFGGAKAGYLTVDDFSYLRGAGTIAGSVIDKGEIQVGTFYIYNVAQPAGTLKIIGAAGGVHSSDVLTVDTYASVTASGGGVIQSAYGIDLAGGTLSVDGTSVIEAGLVGGATSGNITIDPNANLTGVGSIVGPVVNNGSIDVTGGTLTISGALSGGGTASIGADSALVLEGAASGGEIAFAWGGNGETLRINGSTMPTNVISGFAPGDKIDLAGVSFLNGGSAQLLNSGADDELQINTSDGATSNTYELNLGAAANLPQESFKLSSDGAGGLLITASAGLSINISYDQSVVSATDGAEIESAIDDVVDGAEREFTNPITVNISAGWGEIDNKLVPSSEAESGQNNSFYTFEDVVNALKNDATSIDDAIAVNNLPNQDPGSGGEDFRVPDAEAKALRLPLADNAPATDGWIGFATNLTPSDPSFIGLVEHELSEVLGRVSGVNENLSFSGYYSVLGLFRYYAGPPILREPDSATGPNSQGATYFSIDGGVTAINTFSNTPSQDPGGDWVGNRPDAFNAKLDVGQNAPISPGDLIEMNVLGYSLACYCRATRIATPRGDVAIEDLREGDLIVTAAGATRPVIWIGHRALDVAAHPDPQKLWPIGIAAHAFGEGQPERDLWLSPGHNIAAFGVLAPASALVNGVSVAQVEVAHVEYWHVELDRHDVILAEGLPAESYLDTGNRCAFANGGAFVEAHPDFAPKHWAETCLPLAHDGPKLTAIKSLLIQRLLTRGCEIDEDNDAHLLADGERIEPLLRTELRLAFALPEQRRSIALQSRVFTPAHVDPESRDQRRVGLCVGRLEIDGETVALDAAAAPGQGWHAPQTRDGQFDHRWTDGAAHLPPGARVVVVHLAGRGFYWRERGGGAELRVASK